MLGASARLAQETPGDSICVPLYRAPAGAARAGAEDLERSARRKRRRAGLTYQQSPLVLGNSHLDEGNSATEQTKVVREPRKDMPSATYCLRSRSAMVLDRAAGAGVVDVEDSTAHHPSQQSYSLE